MSAALRISVAISGGRACLCPSDAMASAVLAVVAAAAAPRPMPAPALAARCIVVLPLAGAVVPCPLRRRLRLGRTAPALRLGRVVPGALLVAAPVDLVGPPAGHVAPPRRLAGQRWPLLAGRPGRSVACHPGPGRRQGGGGGRRSAVGPIGRRPIAARRAVPSLTSGGPCSCSRARAWTGSWPTGADPSGRRSCPRAATAVTRRLPRCDRLRLRPVPAPVLREPVPVRVPPGLAGRRVPPPPVPAD